jgi:hypothetical protein
MLEAREIIRSKGRAMISNKPPGLSQAKLRGQTFENPAGLDDEARKVWD